MTRTTWLIFIGCVLLQVHCAVRQVLKTHSGDPFDSLPKNFWYELSSPFTESYDDLTEPEPNTTPDPLPFFEDHSNSTNVTTQLGSSVFLHCKVHDLRDRTVSWVRRKDNEFHLLTFGLHTYSSDSRYSLNYLHPNDWRLHIQFANERDEGFYECQVSSHPPLVFYVLLNVVVPKVEIVDERGDAIPDKFYKAGSTIELKCVVSQVPQPSSYVTWKHGQRMLNYDTSRGGISVKTDIQPGGAMSRLYIANANKQDSGNYTCSLADVASTTIAVHVLNGENPAAMQHGGCGKWARGLGRWALLQLGFTWILQTFMLHR
ncbi:peroxidasin-like isoform X3 [Zootermopsis nevadensis]|uniref:peroxidasin-like isoform X3 n=1 Tax=Zootermopsis nevadensis TaxID=136037 RepID=UPI000B8E958A|nr:peroxidasin-like isoform X3 [Zootermopsis nevadensis]